MARKLAANASVDVGDVDKSTPKIISGGTDNILFILDQN